MTPQEKKDFVVKVYKETLEQGDLSRIDEYMRDDYIQHGPHATDGKEGFCGFARTFAAQFPERTITFKRVLCDGDLVMTHSHLVPHPGHLGISVMDVFRIEDGKLAEHWEAFLDVPEQTKSGNPMF